MIRLGEEELISLADAARLLPRRKRGKRPHISTLWRWTQHGLRGVKLEFVQVGGQRFTSREALGRFLENLTALREGRPIAIPEPPRLRRKQIAAAEKRLASHGI